MDHLLKDKISHLIKTDDFLRSIQSETPFYFQKAQDTLRDFLDLELDEQAKTFFLTNRKNYDTLKQLPNDKEDVSKFAHLLFTLIAYCDAKAYRKNDLNAYHEKRVLARASVRMNFWVDQFITYKFSRTFTEGSIKNAIEYLLNPEDNFTMLSENHREQISRNLFKKTYDPSRFKSDFFDFFDGFSIIVNNSKNYTYYLSSLAYAIAQDWKESVIGLISPDGTNWKDGAINDSRGGNYIALWNHKKPNGKFNTLKLLRQCIEEHDYFTIFYSSSFTVHYAAEIVDFATSQEELNRANWPERYGKIEWFGNGFFSDFTDEDSGKSASWIYLARKIEKVEPIPIANFTFLRGHKYPSVGGQAAVVSFISNNEVKRKHIMSNYTNLLDYKKQIILQGPPGTGKTYRAKDIAFKLIFGEDISQEKVVRTNQLKRLEQSEQFKLVQFHPSYSYEDFVRGITAKANGTQIEYETENKVLAKFADIALKNKLNSGKAPEAISEENWLQEQFESFVDSISEELAEKGRIRLTDSVGIIKVDEDAFRYKGTEGWSDNGNRMLFDDIIQAYLEENSVRQDIKKNQNLSGLARHHASYYIRVLDLFRKYLHDNNIVFKPSGVAIESLKNFVLIIDEINRANLASVLGELIYALEYRGEEIDGMYAVKGKAKISLPDNLYIIGTMNTADRSVGHIDYAIRRRFAFVDILPDESVITNQIAKELFNEIGVLFRNKEMLASDFKPEQVQLGHSYFMVADDTELRMRAKYEIFPILEEYLKDGILLEKAEILVNNLKSRFAN